MATEHVAISGYVKNRLIGPQGHATRPEGTQVEIVISAAGLPPGLQAEFDAWEWAGDEAWAQSDHSELRRPVPPGGPRAGAGRRSDVGHVPRIEADEIQPATGPGLRIAGSNPFG
jgi:hypothetical protein